MTLEDLRERFKAAYQVALTFQQGVRPPGFVAPTQNMRQHWETNKKRILPFYIDGAWLPVVDKRLLTFHQAGELYYHAKKHGMDSAMLMRLYRS